MKLKSGKRISVLVGSTLLATAAVVGTFALSSSFTEAKAQLAEIAGEIAGTYTYRSNFSVPTVELIYGGNRYQTNDCVVYYPNGESTTAKSCFLDSVGEYKVVYYATAGTTKIKAEKYFLVKRGSYETATGNSTIVYGDMTYTKDPTEGLKVSIADGDSFTYNRPIDLTENGENIITFFTRSCNNRYNGGTNDRKNISNGRSDVENLYITLTDCYNPENYVEFVIDYENAQGSKVMYYRASACGSESVGIEINDINAGIPIGSILNINGTDRKEVYIDDYRYVARYANLGLTSAGKALTNPEITDKTDPNYYYSDENGNKIWVAWDEGFTLSYDTEENRLYFQDGAKRIVSDLDDENIYENGLFSGFTTGEVYLSVRGENYLEASLDLEIVSIGNDKGEDLKLAELTDNQRPKIQTTATRSSYQILKGKPFELFEATAVDINSTNQVKANLYYNYGTSAQVNVSVKDGKFIPTRVGTYTLVYSTADTYGNVSEELKITLNSVEKESGTLVDFSVGKIDALVAGEKISLPKYSIDSANGGTYVNTYITVNGERTLITKDSFLPMQAADYTISYEYGDCVYSYNMEYTVKATASGKIVYLDAPILPEYVIKNASYSLDKFYAYICEGATPTARLADVEIAQDDGEFVKVNPEKITVTANERIRLRYSCDGVAYETVQEIPVVDVEFGGDIDQAKYFVGDFEKTAQEDGVFLKSTVYGGSNTSKFVLPISFTTFQFDFQVPSGYENFQQMDITLVDYYQRDRILTISYKNLSGFTAISFDGRPDKWKVNTPFADSLARISYNANLKTFTDQDGFSFPLKETFSSDKALLSVTFKNIKGQSGVLIQKICNQPLSNETSESITPIIDVEMASGRWALDSVVTISQLDAVDILSPILKESITLRVLSPSGKVVTSLDNVTLDEGCPIDRSYEIKLSEMGLYQVYYTISDQNYNSMSLYYAISVTDMKAPSLEIDDGYGDNKWAVATYGNYVKVKGYTVSDDYTESENIGVFITVFSPRGEVILLDGDSFYADEKGTWTVYYSAYDEVENCVMKSYKIVVK